MRLRSFLIIVLGLTLAGGSAFFSRHLLQASTPPPEKTETMPMGSVVVARSEIPFGSEIQPHMLATQPWPAAAMPEGAFQSLEAALGRDGQPPRRARYALAPGEPLLSAKVSDFGEKVTIVQKLSPEARAIAIRVDAVSGVAGFVTPGDRVDIVLTHGGGETLTATTILRDIRVIGVDQLTDTAKDRPSVARTVTVEVTPEQGQLLALAQRAGALSLTLRPFGKSPGKPLKRSVLADVLDPTAEDAPQAPSASVVVRRANKAEIVHVK